MIKLTSGNGKLIYLSPEGIISISQGDLGTVITFSENNATIVSEDPEEVTRKILEYKLNMMRFSSLANNWANETENKKIGEISYILDNWQRSIERLAGLEDDDE